MELRVFVVEDVANMRDLLKEVLASIGGMRLVGTASTEPEAKLWLEDNVGTWDVAVVDLVLDQGSGFGVVSFAKRNWPGQKVAVFSSYVSPGVQAHLRAMGADAIFDKVQSAPFIAWLAACTTKAPD